MLRAELKIQRSLPPHPNVVRMLSAFETPVELAAVTEFVAGGELHSLTHAADSKEAREDDREGRPRRQRRRPLTEKRVREIAGDVLSALHFLHSNRILHRDVKPQNILISKDGLFFFSSLSSCCEFAT